MGGVTLSWASPGYPSHGRFHRRGEAFFPVMSSQASRWWSFKVNIMAYGCFQKYGKTPKSSILIGFSILGYPYFWKHPNIMAIVNLSLFPPTYPTGNKTLLWSGLIHHWFLLWSGKWVGLVWGSLALLEISCHPDSAPPGICEIGNMLESSRVRSSVNQMEQKRNISCCFHCEDVIAMMTRDMIEEPFVETPLNVLHLKGT